MESPTEPLSWSEWARSVEPWVLPTIAAVVVGGVLLLCTLIGSFWLASRRSQQPIVIWMTTPATSTVADHDREPAVNVNR